MTNRKLFKQEFGGQERTFWLGLGFLSSFLKETGTSIDSFDKALQKNPFEMIPTMVYCSIKYGYDRVDADLDFTKFQVIEWIDEAGGVGGKFITDFLKYFGEAMTTVDDGSKKAKAIKSKTVVSKKKATLS